MITRKIINNKNKNKMKEQNNYTDASNHKEIKKTNNKRCNDK